MSLAKSRGYRIVRMHPINQHLLNRATRASSPARTNLRSICLVFPKKSSLVQQELEQPSQNNNIRLYDSNTFMEANFDRVLRDPSQIELWRELGPTIDIRHHNSLFVVLQQQPRSLLINHPLLQQYRLDSKEFYSRRQQWGLFQRTADKLSQQLDKQAREEIVVSVLGFCHTTMVDLLNLSREGHQEKLKITREGSNTTVVNLTQMEVQNPQFLVNTLLYARHFGNLYEKNTGQQIEAELYQLSVCKLSVDGLSIESITGKCSFVRLTNNSNSLKNTLQNCLRSIGKEQNFLPSRSCKLTHSIEDCLNSKTSITLLTEVDTGGSIKSQMDAVAFHSSLQGRTLLRKVPSNAMQNYYGDEEIVRKITDLSLSRISDTIPKTPSELEGMKVRSQKLPSLKGKINPALLSETVSSSQRKTSLMEERTHSHQRSPVSQNPYNLSNSQRNQVIRQLYKFV